MFIDSFCSWVSKSFWNALWNMKQVKENRRKYYVKENRRKYYVMPTFSFLTSISKYEQLFKKISCTVSYIYIYILTALINILVVVMLAYWNFALYFEFIFFPSKLVLSLCHIYLFNFLKFVIDLYSTCYSEQWSWHSLSLYEC